MQGHIEGFGYCHLVINDLTFSVEIMNINYPRIRFHIFDKMSVRDRVKGLEINFKLNPKS